MGFMVVVFDIMDYSWELMEFDFKKRLQFFYQHLFYFIGLASFLALIQVVPVMNYAIFPFMIVAETYVFALILKNQKVQDKLM